MNEYALFLNSQMGSVRLPATLDPSQWFLEDETMPEGKFHRFRTELLASILARWASLQSRNIEVLCNFACRWAPDDERIGIDPDVVLCDPAPHDLQEHEAIQVWLPHHKPPKICIEIVSRTTAEKDYVESVGRCELLGASELWLFDPNRYGSKKTGENYTLQVYSRDDQGQMIAIHKGEGPAPTIALGAWLVVVEEPNVGKVLRIAKDPKGKELWPTAEEEAKTKEKAAATKAKAEAAKAKMAEHRANRLAVIVEEERAAKEAAEAEVARLRALISKLQK